MSRSHGPFGNWHFKVVPWYNAEEFKKVYQQLYSDEISEKKHALDQIAVWQTRCHPSLPSAIEASFALMTAIVQDNLWMNSSSVVQQLDVQSLYASAIIRFVNLTIEVHEKEYGLNSMANWAKNLGIPSYILDIRNEASHSVKPSIYCLRIAAEFAMNFLKETYWEKEASDMRDFIKEPPDETYVTNLIIDYITLKYGIAFEVEPKVVLAEEKSKFDIVLKNIQIQLKRDKKLFVKVLASSDYFIPSDDVILSLIGKEELDVFKVESDEDPINDASQMEAVTTIPFNHEVLWFDMINSLNMYDAVPLFLEELLKSQNTRSVMGQRLIISWVKRILNIRANGRNENTILKRIFKEKGIVVDWYTMLYAALQNPCKYALHILPLIVCNLDVKRDFSAKEIVYAATIFLGQTVDSENLSEIPPIHTVEETAKVKKLQEAEAEKKDGGGDNIWFVPSDDSYKKWPLGYIINTNDGNEMDLTEEDNFVASETNEFVDKIFNNENDIVECPEEDVQSSINYDEIKAEFLKVKNFLYTK